MHPGSELASFLSSLPWFGSAVHPPGYPPAFLQTHPPSGGTLHQGPLTGGTAAIRCEAAASPAGAQGATPVPSANTLKQHRGYSPQLSDLTPSKCCGMKSEAGHNAPPLNHKLGKISERFKQYGEASSVPVWTWKWIRAGQLSPLHSVQPNPEVETLSHVRRTCAPIDSPCSSVRPLLEPAYHYKAKQITRVFIY